MIKETEVIGKITFEDQSDQKAIISIKGQGSEMESASVEFVPEIKNDSKSIAANLAVSFMKFLIGK